MASSTAEGCRQRLSGELRIKDLEDGKMLDGDCGTDCSPPDGFDMAKFYRGRQFYRDHLFHCSIAMFFSLVIGTSIPQFSEALIFTSQSDTPEKAFKRYAKTFYHVSLWHYGNIWEKDSMAQKSVLEVRQMHRVVRKNMQKADAGRSLHKFVSQYDMGVVLSGFMCAIVMYPEDGGLRCTLDDLDDYVYFWYGVGHLLGIQKKYNICAHGLSQALMFCKGIEQDIVVKNLQKPQPEYIQVAATIVQAFQRSHFPWSLITLPVISALSYETIMGDTGALSFSDTIRYLIWKLIIFTSKYVPWFKRYLNRSVENRCKLKFLEM